MAWRKQEMTKILPETKDNFIKESTQLLSAMASDRRLAILQILQTCECSVGALSKMVGLSQSALSQQLSILRRAGLVTSRRDAQTIYYSCTSLAVARILTMMGQFFENDPDTTAPPSSKGPT